MRTPSGAAERTATALVTVALAISAGCRSAKTEGAGADASAAASRASGDAATPASPASHDGHAAGRPAPARPCTITMAAGAALPDEDPTTWLTLPEGRRLAVREHESGRELSFQGPGRVLPCARGVTLLGEGAVAGRPFAGEAPGSEQWVATACGVLRWASGSKRVTAAIGVEDRGRCTFEIGTGSASWYLPADVVATGDDTPPAEGPPTFHVASGKRTLEISDKTRTPGYFRSPAGIRHALEACERTAEDVQGIARAMLDGSALGAARSDLAERSVAARGLARAACAVADVRSALSGEKPEDRARLEKALATFREDAAPAENPAADAGNRE